MIKVIQGARVKDISEKDINPVPKELPGLGRDRQTGVPITWM